MNDSYNENQFKGNIEGTFTAIFTGMEMSVGDWGERYGFTFTNEDRTFVEYVPRAEPNKRNKLGRFLKYLSGKEVNGNYSPNPSSYIGKEYFLLCDRNQVGSIVIRCVALIPDGGLIQRSAETVPFVKELDIDKLNSETHCDNGLPVEEDARLCAEWEEKQETTGYSCKR
jgi:hypothetical protein